MSNLKSVGMYPAKESIKKYTRNSSVSSGIWRSHEIMALSGIKLYRPVLDLGCGNGRFAKVVFKDKLDYGLDISREVIKIAKSNKAYRNYIVADAHHIPLGNQSIQTVFSNSVFEHIADLEGVLAEISRILKPGGQLIFTTHAPTSKEFYGLKIFNKLNLKTLSKIYLKIFIQALQIRTLWDLKVWRKKLKTVGLRLAESKVIISPKSAYFFELFLPYTFIQNRLTFLKKIRLTPLIISLINPNYSCYPKTGRNYYIRAKKPK